MIKTITLENFKGTTNSLNLGQLNIFRGASGSGKSTWLEAFRVAVLGYDPSYGRLLAETMEFSSDESMSVEISDDEFSVRRVFSSHGGKMTQKIFVNKEAMTAKAAEPDLSKHFGNFPLMLNPSEFFDMSDDKKITFLFGLSETDMNSDNLRRKCLLDILRRYTEAVDFILEYEFEDADPFEMAEDIFANFLGKSIKKIAEKDVPAGRAITKIFAEFLTATLATGQETLSSYAHVLRAEINATRRSKQDAEAANRKLIEEKASKMNLVFYNEEGNLEEIKKLRSRISEIEKTIHANEKVEEAKGRMLSGLEGTKSLIAQNLKGIKEEKTKVLSKDELASKVEKIAQLKKTIEKLNAQLLTGTKNAYQIEEVVIRQKASIYELKMATTTNQPNYICSECGESMRCPKKCNFDLQKKVETEDKKIKEEERKLETLIGSEAEAQKNCTHISELISKNEDLLMKLTGAIEADDYYVKKIKIMETSVVELKYTLKEYEESVSKAEEPGAGNDILKGQLSGLKKSLSERLVAEKNHQWLRTLEGTIASSNETIFNSDGMLSALNVAESVIKVVRNELTASATRPIEHKCGYLLKRVRPNLNLKYNILDGKFDISCMNVSGNVVQFSVLSGGEKVLYLSAQLLALMMIVDPKLKILLVEMGELSGDLVPDFMDALTEMIVGSDIQILLSSCHRDFDVPDPKMWTIHEMGGE